MSVLGSTKVISYNYHNKFGILIVNSSISVGNLIDCIKFQTKAFLFKSAFLNRVNIMYLDLEDLLIMNESDEIDLFDHFYADFPVNLPFHSSNSSATMEGEISEGLEELDMDSSENGDNASSVENFPLARSVLGQLLL